MFNFKENKKNKWYKTNKINKSKHNTSKNQEVKKELFCKKTIISVSRGREKGDFWEQTQIIQKEQVLKRRKR